MLYWVLIYKDNDIDLVRFKRRRRIQLIYSIVAVCAIIIKVKIQPTSQRMDYSQNKLFLHCFTRDMI